MFLLHNHVIWSVVENRRTYLDIEDIRYHLIFIFPLYCSTLCNRICGLSNTWEWMGEKMNYLSPHFLIDKPKISLEPFIMYLMMQLIDGFLIFQLLSFNLIWLKIIFISRNKSICESYFYAEIIIRKKITIEQTVWNNGISTLIRMIQ